MISKNETKQLQGVAIIAMLCLHLFCTLEPSFTPLVYIGSTPLTYFIGQASDCCVMIYCFCSGYGLMSSYVSEKENGKEYLKGRIKGVFRLLKSYWIVLILFGIVALMLGKASEWLVSPMVFLGNFFTLWYSYNGAWWFVSTYIIMVLLSPIVFKAVQRCPIIVAVLSPVVYFISYVMRFKYGDGFWLQHIARLGMSYAELLLGVYFYKYMLMSKIEKLWSKIIPQKITPVILITLVCLTIVIRRYIPTLFIAPVSGLAFIICYLLAERRLSMLRKPFEFFGKHSMNMWLTHMFFYMPMYGGLAYLAKYPLFILMMLVLLSFVASCIINLIYKIFTIKFIKSKLEFIM